MGHEAAIAAIRAQGGTDADVEAYLRSVGAVETTPSRQPLSPRMQAAGKAIREDINRREQGHRTNSEQMANVAVSALDAGTFGLAGLATDALLPGTFRENRDFRRAEMARMPAADRLGSTVIGALANPIGRFLPRSTFLPAAKATTGLFGVGLRGAAEGAMQGAVSAFGENVGSTGGVRDPMLWGAGFGGLLGGGVGAAAARNVRGQNATNAAGEMMTNAEMSAARRLIDAQQADAAMGYTVPAVRPSGTGMPRPMDIDVAGPSVMAHARGAVRTTEGRTAAEAALNPRLAEMPDALVGDAPNAVRVGNDLRAARKARANVNYPAAVKATKGQSVDTPFLQQFRQTAAGAVAWNKVQAARSGRVLASGDPLRALPRVDDDAVPDAEAVHEMMGWLRKRAKAAPDQTFPDGVEASDAVDALKLLEGARNDLPVQFRSADAVYADDSRPIEAVALGRKTWRGNPIPGTRGERMAVENVDAALNAMTPANRALAAQGKYFDIATRVRDKKLTPSQMVEALDTPDSVLGRELAETPLAPRARAWANVEKRSAGLLAGEGPAQQPTAKGLIETATQGVSLFGAVASGWRILRSQLSAPARAKIGKEDAAYIRLITGDGDAAKVLAGLSEKDRLAVEAARRASGVAGKVGGLLAP